MEHAADIANDSDADPVIVVLGAHAAEFEPLIDQKKLHIAVNADWEQGLASSIRCGLQTLKRVALLSDAVILTVCDQPYITPEHLNALISTQKETGYPVVASEYGNTLGTPVLFFKSVFAELLELKGDRGAKNIIEKYSDQRSALRFDKGNIDIDTESDYNDLQQESSA